MRGTAVMLEKGNSHVKIELISGNSELNYFIGSDKKIKELDMGSESNLTMPIAVNSLYEKYPEFKFAFTAFCVYNSEGNLEMRNNYATAYSYIDHISSSRMLPYLIAYVEKILNALGYSITENQLLEDEVLCRLLILHSRKTLEYNQILPDWTVKDFLTEVEKFCNVVFVIDRYSLSTRIIFNYNRTQVVDTVCIDSIIDEYTSKIDRENKIEVLNYQHVKYKFPDDDYYKYRCVPDEKELFQSPDTVIQEYETFDELATALGNDLEKVYNNNTVYLVNKSYSGGTFLINGVKFEVPVVECPDYFVVSVKADPDSSYYLRRINQFGTFGEETGDTVELRIIPAKMLLVSDEEIYFDKKEFNGMYDWFTYQQMPLIKEINNEKQGVIDIIESGKTKEEDNDTIQVAIHMAPGIWSQTDMFDSHGTGINVTQNFSNDWKDLTEEERIAKTKRAAKFNLRLSGPFGMCHRNYNKNKNISAREVWNISFKTDKNITPQSTFIIRNRKFICVSLETEFDINGALPIIKGKFYPEDDD
ncbi:MAG: hypothetical protein LBM08_14255 [Dysgonamonadaceae bacterium]|nr:hypothetical protein [Dysgonamonadaceae bacterium]